MTITESLALILIIVSFIKLITIAVRPSAWFDNVVKKVYGSGSKTVSWVMLVLALIVLYYLLQDGITIVQILAVTLFVVLIIGMGFVTVSGEFLTLADNLYKDRNILKRFWLSTLVWVILLVWGIKEIFF